MRNAVLRGACAGLLGLTALSSTGGAQGTLNAASQCAPAGREQSTARLPGGLLRDELPWLATGMTREQVARFLQSCGAVEGTGKALPEARQPARVPGVLPGVGHTQRR
jgi:hypothetical protein